MSKKNKNNTKSKLIPELRFPEFKDKPQWEVKTIGEVSFVNMGQSPKSAFYNTEAEGLPLIQGNADIQNRLSAPKVYTSQITKQCQTGDLLISVRAPVGTIAKSAHNACIGRGIAAIRAKENTSQEFLYQFFFKFESSWDSISQGGTFDAINRDALLQLPLPLPSLAEQERIGALFSTLDSLIQAQSKEVQLLRLRKKGLMQKMFPYEGETTPEWRFPEFNDAPEWEEVSFIDCIKLYRGSSPRPIKNYITKDKDGVNWIKIGDATNCENKIINNVSEKITREGALRSRKVTKGELILANSMSYGKVYELGIDGYIYDGWFVLREYEEHYNRDFLRFMLNSDFIQKQYRQTSAGGVVLNISSDIVYNTQLYLTSKAEQERIASVFSTLDALIEAKSQRLEQLKKHKKGLMQQLFP